MSVIEGLPANQDMLGEPVTDFELSPGFPVPPAERPLPAFDARYGWRPTVEPDGLVFAGIIRSRRTAPQGVVGTWTPAEIATAEREDV